MTRSKGIGFICTGDGAQLKCAADYRAFIEEPLYLRHLDRHDLNEYRAIVVPDFSSQPQLERHSV